MFIIFLQHRIIWSQHSLKANCLYGPVSWSCVPHVIQYRSRYFVIITITSKLDHSKNNKHVNLSKHFWHRIRHLPSLRPGQMLGSREVEYCVAVVCSCAGKSLKVYRTNILASGHVNTRSWVGHGQLCRPSLNTPTGAKRKSMCKRMQLQIAIVYSASLIKDKTDAAC